MTKSYAYFLNKFYYFLQENDKYNFDNLGDIAKFDKNLKNNHEHNLLYKIKKNGIKICELPYIQPPDEEGSKTASSYFRFIFLGFSYFTRIVITRFRKNYVRR